MLKNVIYALTCLAFTITIGGATYEHLNVVPRWSAAPPVSLSMFQGEYGLNPALFWMVIHPVNLLLFIVTTVLFWKTDRRKNTITVFAAYIVILMITSIYFVPELISITTTPFSNTVDASLTQRAAQWELLSIVRLFVLIGLALYLFLGLTKPLKKTHANPTSFDAAALATGRKPGIRSTIPLS
jgi:hypothetical protein